MSPSQSVSFTAVFAGCISHPNSGGEVPLQVGLFSTEEEKSVRKRIVVGVVGLILGFFCAGIHAQQVTGRILGSTEDASGAAVPNAQITITNQDTGAVRNIVTGADGAY